jgi:hypothetical protein
MADYIYSFEHRKPTSTDTPMETVLLAEPMRNIVLFFAPGSLSFTFGADVNDKIDLKVHHALKARASFTLTGNLRFQK